MFGFVIGALIGALIAWCVPQPAWAKRVTDKIRGKIQ